MNTKNNTQMMLRFMDVLLSNIISFIYPVIFFGVLACLGELPITSDWPT
jgi:hypothetical protein